MNRPLALTWKAPLLLALAASTFGCSPFGGKSALRLDPQTRREKAITAKALQDPFPTAAEAGLASP